MERQYRPTKTKKDLLMSSYTDSMVAEMTKIGAFDFASAQAFAQKHSLTARSVVSKVKSLGLAYTPKPKAASKGGADRVRKSDTVREIAAKLGADYDSLAGLEKSDAKSLAALLTSVS